MGGLAGNVYALEVSETNLYVGGYFFAAGGTPAGCIAKWDGSTWSALGSVMHEPVHALLADGTNLFAGGDFWYFSASGNEADIIAKWNGSPWFSLGSGGG